MPQRVVDGQQRWLERNAHTPHPSIPPRHPMLAAHAVPAGLGVCNTRTPNPEVVSHQRLCSTITCMHAIVGAICIEWHGIAAIITGWGAPPPARTGCYNGYTFQAIQVPFLQALGSSQGFHFDHETMQPMLDNAGGVGGIRWGGGGGAQAWPHTAGRTGTLYVCGVHVVCVYACVRGCGCVHACMHTCVRARHERQGAVHQSVRSEGQKGLRRRVPWCMAVVLVVCMDVGEARLDMPSPAPPIVILWGFYHSLCTCLSSHAGMIRT